MIQRPEILPGDAQIDRTGWVKTYEDTFRCFECDDALIEGLCWACNPTIVAKARAVTPPGARLLSIELLDTPDDSPRARVFYRHHGVAKANRMEIDL